ncbi:MAG: hypothetical protein KAR65_10415 [Anaerolineales bacterium]|nr:hypothetical protein [Anaerolineales bacterium]
MSRQTSLLQRDVLLKAILKNNLGEIKTRPGFAELLSTSSGKIGKGFILLLASGVESSWYDINRRGEVLSPKFP